jgi:hypothetical protein
MHRLRDQALWQILSAIALACAVVTTCPAANRVSAIEMQGRLQYRGFSVKRPPLAWYLNESEQTNTRFILRRDFPQPDHTIFLSVTLGSVPATPKFADTIQHLFNKSSQRGKILSYRQSEYTVQGQPAVRYERTSQDLLLSKAGKPVIMRDQGIVVLHPAFSKAALNIVFSERAPKPELDDAAFSQADQMIGLITVEIRPGVPAGNTR